MISIDDKLYLSLTIWDQEHGWSISLLIQAGGTHESLTATSELNLCNKRSLCLVKLVTLHVPGQVKF